MKQIYNLFKSLNRFEKILVAITLLSFVALIMLVLDFQFIPNIFNLKPSVIANINNLINDLSIGIIASFIFYIIVQWFPEKEKERVSKKLIHKEVDLIMVNIDKFLLKYTEVYLPGIDVNNLKDEDIDKIKFLEIKKHTKNEVQKIFHRYKYEMLEIKSFSNLINDNLECIIKNPYVNNLPNLLIEIYSFKENEFNDFINFLYKMYESDIDYQTHPEYPMFNDFNYLYNKNHCDKFIEFLKRIYLLRLYLLNFTSSSSKQSSSHAPKKV